jgi:hypothetical protein
LTTTEDLRLKWDAFIEGAVEQRVAHEPARESYQTGLRDMIDVFRQNEWPAIQRELLNIHRWEITDGLEPHWVEPGKAVYWQQQVVREIKTDDEGVRRVEWVSRKWEPTSGLPANNASQIAHYLEKGFRLRPPIEGVLQEALPEDAVLSEGAIEASEPTPDQYICFRHGQKRFGFQDWSGYLAHCRYYQEVLEGDPPAETVKRMNEFPYYCVMHDVGFHNRRLAARHAKGESRRSATAGHPSVEQMEVHRVQGAVT